MADFPGYNSQDETEGIQYSAILTYKNETFLKNGLLNHAGNMQRTEFQGKLR